MTEKLRVSYLQADLIWENQSANLSKLEGIIRQMPQSDLIVLPEMFPTGFSMNPSEISDTVDGEVITWMHRQAHETQAAIAGSLVVAHEGNFYNRFYLAKPDGSGLNYDKRHLFRMGNEHLYYIQGQERVVFEINGWRIRPIICYDIRFPVWTRNVGDYDILLVVANWPAKRRDHWLTLLKARAIENQAYTIGVNRSGVDGNGYIYSGDSAIFTPDGVNICGDTYNKSDYVEYHELLSEKVDNFRKYFPAWQDADPFELL
jgi:predicted amidohydrolase